jgi:hypothetical protein
VRGGVAVQGDHPRCAVLPHRPGKEPLVPHPCCAFCSGGNRRCGPFYPRLGTGKSIGPGPLGTSRPRAGNRPPEGHTCASASQTPARNAVPTAGSWCGPRQCPARPSFGRAHGS